MNEQNIIFLLANNMTSKLRYIYIIMCTICCTGTMHAGGGNASADSLMAEGRRHFGHRQADEALQCFNTAFQQAGNDHKLRIRALNNIACVHKYFYQDYIKAYDYFQKAYNLCDSTADSDFMPVIMVNLGDLISDYGLTANSTQLAQQAHDIFNQCMQRAVEAQNWELMITAFFNLSNQNYSLPLEQYSILFSKDIPDSTLDLQYARLQYDGIRLVQQGDYAAAREKFMAQLPVVSARWEPERDSIATYMSIAHTYNMQHDYAHAIAWLEKAYRLAVYNDINDQAAVIGNLTVEARAALLDDRQRMQQYIILAALIALMTVVGSAWLLWRKNRQLHQHNRLLYDNYQQLLHAEQEEQLLRKNLVEAKYSSSNLSDKQKDTLIVSIEELLSQPDVICQPEFTVAKLAKSVDSNTTYVSQVINEHYQTSFSNVLASRRIREACRRMSDEQGQYRNQTIEAIATGVGFKSRTAFINAFKREVGLTPREYLKMAKTS